jgi:hypothetical protein
VEDLDRTKWMRATVEAVVHIQLLLLGALTARRRDLERHSPGHRVGLLLRRPRIE